VGHTKQARRRRASPGKLAGDPLPETNMPQRVKAWLEAHPRTHLAVITLYYFAIIAGLIALYGRGDFSTPAFVYQEF